MTSVVAQAISIQRELLDNLHQQCALSRHVESWESLEEAVRRAKILGTLDHEQELSISIVARNVSIIAGAVTSVDCEMLGQIDNLSRTFKAILHTDNPGHGFKRRRGEDKAALRASKRHHNECNGHLETACIRSTSDLDPVRQFFIDNIANPYPSASQKDALCLAASITRKKLESDLTNWRRRSEWTDIMNTYCSGNKTLMQKMIEDLESGRVDVGEEIRGRYERMKGYLEKRDEQAGEWVFQIEEMVRNGEIGPNAHVVELDEVDEGLERMEGSSDADAEGESDDDFSPVDEFRSAPAQIGSKPAFQLVPMPSPGSDSSTSPLSSLTSPTQPGQLTKTSTTLNSTVLAPSALTTVTHQPYTRAPSTKSSYSSLSAVSGIAAQSHSRSTSGSTSIRSVSSSSSTGPTIDPRLRHLKRPAQVESHTRSSRSRVEEILTKEPASWVENHDPTQSFHIGSDPAQAAPRTMELTPYLMTTSGSSGFDASAWSAETSFVFLPHVAQPTVGAFELPPEYEFTYAHDPSGK